MTYISSSAYLSRMTKEKFDEFYGNRTFIRVKGGVYKFQNKKEDIIELDVQKLEQFESDEKMTKYKGNIMTVEQLIKEINRGKKDTIPPILVRKYNEYYQVIDGHHRLFAFKKTNQEKIKCVVIPNECIEFVKFI